jgi:hypothetical protein
MTQPNSTATGATQTQATAQELARIAAETAVHHRRLPGLTAAGRVAPLQDHRWYQSSFRCCSTAGTGVVQDRGDGGVGVGDGDVQVVAELANQPQAAAAGGAQRDRRGAGRAGRVRCR